MADFIFLGSKITTDGDCSHEIKRCLMKSISRVRLFTTPWTAAHQAPPPVGFSRQEYWSGVPLPSPPHATVKIKDPMPQLRCGAARYINKYFILKVQIPGLPWRSSGLLCASNAGGVGSISGWGTKIPHAACCSLNKQIQVRKLDFWFYRS